jgi:hypothetical protein
MREKINLEAITKYSERKSESDDTRQTVPCSAVSNRNGTIAYID